ncbi:divergent polysaccharide deacetylase family protein [Marispirochaeta sp.]|jgi:uncharacterized protein|uniref:divergent polysaccharide deacetylase family protein n=1 Tax=Marispirochaeta sp. TaxID=2038653 RepID=UPI0029C63BCB|nr:divergent polysaccharide deacetylase family protein [Marispirochaeta sp.]
MRRSGSTATRGKSKTYLSYLLLGATALMLGISIALVQGWIEKSEAVKVVAPETPLKVSTSDKIAEPAEPPEPAPKPSAVIPVPPKIYVVIDDVGNNLAELEPFLALPMPITFAVMPQRRYTRQAVERIQQEKKHYIMHQPMEPVGDADPGVGAIYTGMTKTEIYDLLNMNLASMGGAPGMNNHMGSKATADSETMQTVLKYLKEQNMFFLDSVTTGESVAGRIAAEISLPYIERNSMFLDNKRERDYVERALRSGFSLAETSGRAVMIGHVWDEHLAELLLELYPEFTDEGFSFDDIGSMIYLGRQDVDE